MSYSETLEERDGYRVRIVRDEYGDTPYDCSQSPLLRIDYRSYGGGATFVDTSEMRPHQEDEYILNAISHWQTDPSDRDWKLFEKYLRAFFGVTTIETWASQDYWYITYDSEGWRRSLTVDGADGEFKPSMEEYRAWCEGECYFYVIEKQETWVKQDPTTDDPAYLDTMTTWETVDSCGGYYGDEYVKEAALEAFVAEAGEKVLWTTYSAD
jgi:hypothetical protein